MAVAGVSATVQSFSLLLFAAIRPEREQYDSGTCLSHSGSGVVVLGPLWATLPASGRPLHQPASSGGLAE